MDARTSVPTLADIPRPQPPRVSEAHNSAPTALPPASNTGATTEENTAIAGDGFFGWDWSSTTHDGHDGIGSELLRALGAVHTLPGKGLQGWARSVQAFDADGHGLGSIYHGGGRDDVHVVSTSAAADASRRAVIGIGNARTARVDTRVDTLLPFDALEKTLTAAARTYGARITYMESKENGISLGRTLYLGAPSSRVRVRVYEKWLQSPGEYVEGTNRVEVQLRPDSKAKAFVSSWGPAATFCASRTTRDLAQRLGADLTPEVTLRVKRPTPTLEESLEAMGNQYGKGVRQWLDLTGGDWGRVMDYLASEKPSEAPAML